MDIEYFQSMNSGTESVTTDSPTAKVPRADNTSAVIGDLDVNVEHGYFDTVGENYSTSDSTAAVTNSSSAPEINIPLEKSETELDKNDVIASNHAKQGSSENGRCQSNIAEKTPESVPSEYATDTETVFDATISDAQTKAWEDDILKCFQKSNVNLQRHEHVSSSPDIDLTPLHEIAEVIDKNQSKTKEMLTVGYLCCPIKFQKVKELLSYFRKDIPGHLVSTGEDQRNSVGSGYLKALINRPGCSEMLQLLADAVKSMESKLEPVDHGLNNDASVTDASCEPSQNRAGFNDVQVPDIVREEDLDANETTDIDIADDDDNDMPSSSSIQRPNTDTTYTWQQKITDKLLQKLQMESNRSNSKINGKICKMGKQLFITLFSEKERANGFARQRKNQPAYDEEKVNEISQLINFILSPNNDCSVEKFRSGQRKNKGLEGQKWAYFKERVLVQFGCDERTRINRKKSFEN